MIRVSKVLVPAERSHLSPAANRSSKSRSNSMFNMYRSNTMDMQNKNAGNTAEDNNNRQTATFSSTMYLFNPDLNGKNEFTLGSSTCKDKKDVGTTRRRKSKRYLEVVGTAPSHIRKVSLRSSSSGGSGHKSLRKRHGNLYSKIYGASQSKDDTGNN